MSFFRTLAIGTLLLVLFDVTSAFAQPVSELARQGEALLSRECAMCHAVGSYGGGPGQMAPPFSEIARRGDHSRIRQALESGISLGHPVMPRLVLRAADIEAIMAYFAAIAEP